MSKIVATDQIVGYDKFLITLTLVGNIKKGLTLNSLPTGYLASFLVICRCVFFKINFLKKKFRNTCTINMSNSLDPDKAQHSVWPGPKVIKLFSCSTQLSTKFQLLKKTKILTNEEVSCLKSQML